MSGDPDLSTPMDLKSAYTIWYRNPGSQSASCCMEMGLEVGGGRWMGGGASEQGGEGWKWMGGDVGLCCVLKCVVCLLVACVLFVVLGGGG